MWDKKGKLGGYLFVVQLLIPCTMVSSQTLYEDDAPMEQLTTETAPRTLYGSDKVWIVEFYASWCGHCQRFAPVWLQFAQSVQHWDDVLGVAAVACSETKNAPLCRRFNIRGYPTIRFLPQNASSDSIGYNFQGRKTSENLKYAAIEFLQMQQKAGGGTGWPQLTQFSSGSEIWKKYPNADRIFAVVVNASSSDFLSQQVILNSLSLYPRVIVGELQEQAVADDYGQRPALFSVARDGRLFAVPNAQTLREITDTLAIFDDEGESESENQNTPPTTLIPTTLPPYRPPKGLHMQDLESSIRYSFWVEIGSQRLLSEGALAALKTHVHVMAKYHPGRDNIMKFLKKTDDWLQTIGEPMSGQKWVDRISKLQTPDAYVPDRIVWTGCDGSEDRFRGYPCSLWMTFHALTVRAYQLRGSEPDYDPQEVLSSMKEYVHHFLGCRHCAHHFGQMASTIESEVQRTSDGIMWLWRSHNKANNRLHGDYTEDPYHPKVQFPPPSLCDDCRDEHRPPNMYDNTTNWEERAVLIFLENYYNKDNIIQDVLPYTFTQAVEHSTQTPTRHPHQTSPTPSTTHTPACPPSSTRWTSCSSTCGSGVSTRLSNINSDCEMRMEMRICNLRPCGAQFGDWSSTPDRVAQCPVSGTTYRASRAIPVTFNNCRTLASAPWRYCGLCPGKCCFPTNWNSTAWMDVMCGPDRMFGKVMVHQILSCQCEDECPSD